MAQKTIPQKINKEIREYLKILKTDELPIQQVWLFGSFAKGKPHKWSDIDLCVVTPKFKSSWDVLQYLWQKRRKNYGLTIEPVGYTTKDFKEGSSLIDEIKRTGIRLKI